MSFLDTGTSPRGTSRRIVVAAAGALALTVAIGVGCGSGGSTSEGTSTTGAGDTSLATTSEATSGPSTTVAGTSDSTVMTTASGGPTTSAGSGASSTTPDPLLPPSGTFLSSHRLSLSGAGVPSNARSVCRTSPGATCSLTFTKEGKTMSLPTQKAGADGVATWDWSPSDIGLTLGHWDVTITAESGSRHEVVHEAIGLDVVA